MARLKTDPTRTMHLIVHFRARSEAALERFSTVSDTDLAPRDYFAPLRHAERLSAIEKRRPFLVGAWELPHGTQVPARANTYLISPDGSITVPTTEITPIKEIPHD